MIEFLSVKQINALRQQSGNTAKRGTFNAVLEVEPKNFVPDQVALLEDDGKTYTIQAAIDRENLLVSFVFNIPRDKLQGESYISPNPLDKTTTYVVMMVATSEAVVVYIGQTGFVQFNYLPGERRIEGDFDFRCLKGKKFTGSFNVYEEGGMQ
jgi:hypothetical protein